MPAAHRLIPIRPVARRDDHWSPRVGRLDLDPVRTRLIQILVGSGTAMIGLIGLISSPSEEYDGWRAALVVAISLTSIPVGVLWCVARWPGPRLLLAFVIYSDVTMTVCLLAKSELVYAIGGTVLFAVVTMLAVIALPLPLCAVHMVYSVVVLIVIAVRAAVADAASIWLVTAHSLTMLLMFASPLILLVYVSELRSRAHDSLVDPLTGLHNRRGARSAMRIFLEAAPAGDAMAMCVVVLDVDGMKNVNDTLGHHAGDALLLDLADHLRSVTDDRWVVARLGGDEFACLRVGPPEDVAENLDSLVRTLSAARLISGLSISVGTASDTLVGTVRAEDTIDDLLREADAHMYLAKVERKRRFASS